MLVQFSVRNFRSIRDEQVLSFVPATKDKTLESNLVGEDPRLLASAVMFGANASGKSNLLKALAFLRGLVQNSATLHQPGAKLTVQPFRLDAMSRNADTVFEIAFVHEAVRYIYTVAVVPERVVREELTAYPKGSPQRWFSRTWNGSAYDWHTSSTSFKVAKDLQERTRDNALFVSVGAQFNHPQLTAIYLWFTKHLGVWNLAADHPARQDDLIGMQAFTSHLVKTDPLAKDFVVRMLAQADLGIADVEVVTLGASSMHLPEGLPAEIRDAILRDLAAGKINTTQMIHRHGEGDGREVFDLIADESAGTIRFYTLLGPLWKMLQDGACIAIDELDASMHPLLMRAVLGILHDPEVNRHGAQVIATCHDPSLLDQDFLRRDQIWLAEKGRDGATVVRPLTDFNPKQKDSIQRRYIAGRYGAVPILPAHMGR